MSNVRRCEREGVDDGCVPTLDYERLLWFPSSASTGVMRNDARRGKNSWKYSKLTVVNLEKSTVITVK